MQVVFFTGGLAAGSTVIVEESMRSMDDLVCKTINFLY